MNLSFRKATIEDLDTLVSYQFNLAKETEALILDKNVLTSGITNLLLDENKGVYWIISFESRDIACVMIQQEWSDWRNGAVWWIHSVYVDKEFRKKGVFKKMYTFFKDKVKSSDALKGLRLYVDKTNITAIKTYDAIGMTREHYDLYEWLED